jgi:hypothetical protein
MGARKTPAKKLAAKRKAAGKTTIQARSSASGGFVILDSPLKLKHLTAAHIKQVVKSTS